MPFPNSISNGISVFIFFFQISFAFLFTASDLFTSWKYTVWNHSWKKKKEQRNGTYQPTPGDLLQRQCFPVAERTITLIPKHQSLLPLTQNHTSNLKTNVAATIYNQSLIQSKHLGERFSFTMRMQKLLKSKCSLCANPISLKYLKLQAMKGIISSPWMSHRNYHNRTCIVQVCMDGKKALYFYQNIHPPSDLGLRLLLSIHCSQRGLCPNIGCNLPHLNLKNCLPQTL